MSEFSINPAYQFALLAPFIVAFLAYERVQTFSITAQTREKLTQKNIAAMRWVEALIIFGFLMFLPLRLVFEANADWRLIIWIQGTLSAAVTLLIICRLGGASLLKKFLPLALLPLLCIPWPTNLEKSVSTMLMSMITAVSVEVVHLIGFAAQRVGNLILLPNGTTIGVEEACSGIRSLFSNIFAAGVLSVMFSLRRSATVLLFVFSIFSALVFNLLRSLILVITAATSGAQLPLLLHDSAGWSVFVVSFVVLYMLAKFLGGSLPVETRESSVEIKPSEEIKSLPLWLSLVGILIVIASEPLVFLYYPTVKPAAEIKISLPVALNLPSSVITKDAARFRAMLFYDKGESWRWNDAKGDWQLFFFRWDSPRLSRLGGAYHRPERCLPNTGWKLIDAPKQTKLELSKDVSLPASITHFVDLSGRHATLLFAHWSDNLNDIGLDTRLDPGERLNDFIHRLRLSQRSALQLSFIGAENSSDTDELLIQKAKALLTAEAAR